MITFSMSADTAFSDMLFHSGEEKPLYQHIQPMRLQAPGLQSVSQ